MGLADSEPPNQITGPNAWRAASVYNRTPPGPRVGQFWRSAEFVRFSVSPGFLWLDFFLAAKSAQKCRELWVWAAAFGSYVYMRTFVILLLAATTLLSACSMPQHSAIVGRWHEVGTTALVAFHEDGTVEMAADISNGRRELRGKYSFISHGKLKLELSGKGEALGPVVYQFILAGEKMTLTDLDGQKTEYLKAQ
jgi:hypothetical protein